MWKKLDWILIAAVSGVIGATCLALWYMVFLAAPLATDIQSSIPASDSAELVPTPEVVTDQSSTQSSADLLARLHVRAIPKNTALDPPIPKGPPPRPVPVIDHRYDGVITPDEISQMKAPLRLSPSQEPKWHDLAAAFRDASLQQRARIDAGQQLTSAFDEEVLASLIPSAWPLVQSLRDDQLKGAGRLSRALGFKSVSAMTEAAMASSEPVAEKPNVEPRVAVAPTAPPPAKAPVLSDHRYDGLLTPAEINRIKLSLKLRPEQEPNWPPVAAILRELGQQQMAQADAGQKPEVTMAGDMAQRFYTAASPLLQTLTEEQKSVVRRRARMMGLEAYASYL